MYFNFSLNIKNFDIFWDKTRQEAAAVSTIIHFIHDDSVWVIRVYDVIMAHINLRVKGCNLRVHMIYGPITLDTPQLTTGPLIGQPRPASASDWSPVTGGRGREMTSVKVTWPLQCVTIIGPRTHTTEPPFKQKLNPTSRPTFCQSSFNSVVGSTMNV